MSSLADRIRASREEWITADGFQFQVRRPTRVQLAKFVDRDASEAIAQCVVGWKVQEKDIVPGGGGLVPPFDAEAFREWMEDRPKLISELSEKLTKIIESNMAQQEESEKNS